MSDDKFMLVSLEDPKMKSLSDVLGNKSCKKIIDYLAENEEASEKDLSDILSMPINTVEYNLKKLLDSGLVNKKKKFFWSKRGKKIPMYELSNKSIIISPKKNVSDKIKSLIPAFLITIAGTISIYAYEKVRNASQLVTKASSDYMYENQAVMGEMASRAVDYSGDIIYSPSPAWLWFMGGALIALFVFAIVNWRKL